ncbi:MAG: hypothetical protein ACYTG7_22240 [Planctomycetota bacterium]
MYRAFTGTSFIYSRVNEEQKGIVASRNIQGIEADRVTVPLPPAAAVNVLHPYIGFVHTIEENHKSFLAIHGCHVNQYGFIDPESTIQKRSQDRVLIGICGGSVAYWFGNLGGETLAEELQEHEPFRGKEIHIVRLGLGSLKQPQQLMILNYILALGGELDFLINIDGFNDTSLSYLDNFKMGVSPCYPAHWYYLSQDFASPDFQVLAGKVIFTRDLRARWAKLFQDWMPSFSITFQLAWKLGDRFLESYTDRAVTAIKKYKIKGAGFQVTGPGADDYSEENIWKELAQLWMRCSVQMEKICRENGIRYFHFLQPNQYVPGSKPMSEEEKKIAIIDYQPWKVGIEKGYPEMLALADELRAQGVNFHDMTMVFSDVEEILYIDNACHFNARGNEIFASRIVPIIVEACNKPLQREE